MVVGIGRLRWALGDGATEEQARKVKRLLIEAGYFDPPPALDDVTLVGVAEIAELAGVSTGSVCQWRNMPAPIAELKATPVWRLADVRDRIEASKDRRGRKNART